MPRRVQPEEDVAEDFVLVAVVVRGGAGDDDALRVDHLSHDAAGAVGRRHLYREPERGPRPQEGYIGLQNHSENDVVFFKEVAVKMLKK